MLCIRPKTDARVELNEAELTPEHGMAGDRWAATRKPSEANGINQLTLMAARVVEMVAGARERWSLAGDQIFVDMDLSEENLPAGMRLSLGEAEIEITELPHLGCSKFGARFGNDAMRFVCAKELRPLRLRGVHARVVRAGRVRVGDRLQKQPQ
ncbi:MAG: MOSC domain-containing protein [Planctomycetes bacterium]|nr:MOSC domain-containing protein [Planctomycetota bacterium]